MSIWTHSAGHGSRRRRVALWALWGLLPFVSLAYQFAAKQAADILVRLPFGPGWAVSALHIPWLQALLLLEIIGFVGWMAILSEMKLSAAFPLSAISYVLVVATGWTGFGEPVTAMQLLGGAAILAGVWLIGGRDAAEGEAP